MIGNISLLEPKASKLPNIKSVRRYKYLKAAEVYSYKLQKDISKYLIEHYFDVSLFSRA